MRYLVKTKYARFIFYYDFDSDAFVLYKDFKSFANHIDLSGYVAKNGNLLAKAFRNDYKFFFDEDLSVTDFRAVLDTLVKQQAALNDNVLYTEEV